MSAAPTNLDYIASIIVLIFIVISALTLFGMGILMAIGAVFSRRPLVTSWPVDQEHTFTSFEQRGATANSQAWVLSLISAAVLAVFAIGVSVGVEPDRRDLGKDMNMSNLTKKRAAAPRPAAAPGAPAAPGAATDAPKPDTAAPAEAPKPDTAAPAEAPATDTPAPEAPKQ
jgi:hypothetical protein